MHLIEKLIGLLTRQVRVVLRAKRKGVSNHFLKANKQSKTSAKNWTDAMTSSWTTSQARQACMGLKSAPQHGHLWIGCLFIGWHFCDKHFSDINYVLKNHYYLISSFFLKVNTGHSVLVLKSQIKPKVALFPTLINAAICWEMYTKHVCTQCNTCNNCWTISCVIMLRVLVGFFATI